MNEDLKWIAENVHEWPQCHTYAVVWYENTSPKISWDSGTAYGESFTRTQWQAARDELSSKPSWDDAPKWARYLAQDWIGTWWFYESRPSCTTKYWHHHNGERYPQQCNIGKVLGDWRNTLERRPENHSTEPIEKVWRGPEDGLPPAGIVCEAKHFGKFEPVEIVAHVNSIDGKKAVWQLIGYNEWGAYCTPEYFRPLHTEEDKAVEEMLALDCEPHEGILSREDFCRKLYQANYRKQEPK